MHKHVGDKRRHRGEIAARKLGSSTAVRGRDEGKGKQHLNALFVRQQRSHDLCANHGRRNKHHHPWHIEDRFGRAHRRSLHKDLDEGVCRRRWFPPSPRRSTLAAILTEARALPVASFARVKAWAKHSASALLLSKYKSDVYHFYKVNNSCQEELLLRVC